MTKTKSQKARAKAQRGAGPKPVGSSSRRRRGQRGPKPQKSQIPIGPKLNKAARRGRAVGAMQSNRRTFSEMLVSDGLNKALQMHNSASIVDRFPRRMEKVADIVPTSTSFAVFLALYLNPGNSVLFPIFSQIAATYEQFRCRFLKFHYVTEAYTASGSNVSAGKIIMATNADPNDYQFANATQMENYAGADRSAPFSSFCHDVINSLKVNRTMPLKEYFVNPGANTSAPSNDSTDKFFDMGLFQFATSGLPSTSVEYGELYVEFEFDMIRPKQQTPLGQSLLSSHLVSSAASTATAAAPLGITGGVLKSGSNIPIVATTTTFSLPIQGEFLVVGAWAASGNNIAALPTFSYGSALTPLTVWNGDGGNAISAFTVSGIVGMISAVVSVTTAGVGAANLITIAGLTSMTGANCDIWVSQISSGIVTLAREEEKKEEISLLKNQVQELGKMMRALMVHIPDEEEKELEILPNPRLIRGNGEIFEKGGRPIRDSLGQTTPVTTPSDMASKKSWFGVQ